MKLKTVLVAFSLFALNTVNAQESKQKEKGLVTGKVYFNYHNNLTEGVQQNSAFELTRAYLGYKYTFSNKFSASILLDAGKNSSGSAHTVFIKNAKLDYQAEDWLIFSAGIIGLKQFKDQEIFWGHRYIYKSFTDEYKFGPSADLGALASIKIGDYLTWDLLMVNGEGYKELQDDTGNTRFGTNLVYKPNRHWILKAYYDTMKGIDADDETKITTISNVALFAGYTFNSHLRVGAEYNLLKDGKTYKDPSKGKDLQGLSFYATYNFKGKWNIFGRYDQLSSNKLPGETVEWNYANDGNTVISGIEFKPTKGINTAINYRFTNFNDSAKNNASSIYFNLELYF